MKQVGGIASFRIGRNTMSVQLPLHSWLRNKIYFYAIPRKRDKFREILLTPFEPKSWLYTWEIKFKITDDKPGIVLEITNILTQKNINIVKQEGITPSNEVDYSFWVLVKLDKYVASKDLEFSDLESIQRILTDELNNSLSSWPIRVEGINIVEILYENHINNVNAFNNNEISLEHLNTYFTSPVRFEVVNNTCDIPVRVLQSLTINYNRNSTLFGTIISDFSHRNFYIIRIFDTKQAVVYLDIRHQHIVGSINEISRLIYEYSEKKYNLIYNRAIINQDPPIDVADIRSAAHWYILLEIDEEHDCNSIFNMIETSNYSFDKGIEVIDYTEAAKKKLKGRYRRKLNRKRINLSYARFLLLLILLACQIFVFFVVIINGQVLLKSASQTFIGSTIISLIVFTIFITDFKAAIEKVRQWITFQK